MTLNEIITYAKDHEIDFDKPVVGHVILNCAVPFTIFKCNKSFKKKLLMLEADVSRQTLLHYLDSVTKHEG